MTCYFRHHKDIFKKAGIQVTSDNKRQIDRTIHSIVGTENKNCSAAWREVKKRITKDEAGLDIENFKTQPLLRLKSVLVRFMQLFRPSSL